MENTEQEFPLVSIITPSYNQGQFIQQTIDSVLNQTYPNIELIVMDGGSTDNTLEIIKSYEGRIRYVSEKDKGQTDAINKGLRLAKGQILSFLNSDDYFYTDTVQRVVQAFQQNDCDWVTGDYQIVNAEGKPIQNAIAGYKRILRAFSSMNIIRITNYIIQPGTFWRRELMEKIGMFDTSLRYVMDYDFWLRAYAVKKPLVLRQRLSAFRIHQQSKGGAQFVAQFDEEVQVLRRYCDNKFVIRLHRAHNVLITTVYKIIK